MAERSDKRLVTIYTDGSCSPNPGPGGWGAVLLFNGGEKVVELSGAERRATNNRMELTAALKALQSLQEAMQVDIVTDSKYLQNGITRWLRTWERTGWQTVEGGEVKNKDLWLSFSSLIQYHTVHWRWIKGHNEDKWNERADQLAVTARKNGARSAEEVVEGVVHMFPGVTWKNSTGAGAWAMVLQYGDFRRVLGGGERETTANRLYLEAVIGGMKALKRTVPVVLHTRSGYLRDGLQSWLPGWRKRNWKTREGADVSNCAQWRELARLKDAFSLTIADVAEENPPCHFQEAKELAREFEAELTVHGKG